MRQCDTVVVPDDNQYERDKGKTFFVKEMPALQAEKWATRMLLALARAGADVGVIQGQGWAGLAFAGLQAMPGLNFAEAEPLMDEMLPFFRILPPATPHQDWDHARSIIINSKDGDGDDIEEIATWLLLRKAFVSVHARFFMKGASSNSTSETRPTPPAS